MSDLTFTLEDCDQILQNYLNSKDKKTYTTDFEIIPRQKNNFIFKISTNQNETICLYAKGKSQKPKIDKILKDFGIEDLQITPKFCCGKSDLLFFEDLTHQKLQTNPNLYDLKHLQKVIEILAKFHAAGANFEKQKLKKLNEEYDLEDCNFDVQIAEDLIWSLIENTENFEEITNNLRQKQKALGFLKVMCHSNLTAGNILFHYENGIPGKCKLINFNTKLYAPPMYDILQLIFFNTTQDFRKLHFEDLLLYYYQQLEDNFKKYSLKIFSIEEFKDCINCLLPVIKLEAVILKKTQELTKLKEELKESLRFLRISREDCYIIVSNFLKTTNYDLINFNLESVEAEDQFLLRIKIRQPSDEILQFLLKSSSNKEIFIYKQILPQIQESVNFLIDCLPICYFQKSQDLIFEDLSSLGFQLVPELYNFKLISVVLKKLAKFHAASLIFEEIQSAKVKTSYRLNDRLNPDFFQIDYSEIISELKNENLNKFFEETETNSRSFRNVLCIGISPKNILIRFENDEPVDCKFGDLANMVYNPPAVDFLTILNLTNEETRSKYKDYLKKIYYDELAKSVADCNLKIEKILSNEEFKESLDYIKPKVLLQSFIYKIFEENFSLVKDKEKRKIFLETKTKEANYKEYVRNNIDELYKKLQK